MENPWPDQEQTIKLRKLYYAKRHRHSCFRFSQNILFIFEKNKQNAVIIRDGHQFGCKMFMSQFVCICYGYIFFFAYPNESPIYWLQTK